MTVELTISRVSKNNQGYYQCFASNLAGDVNRHFFLQVNGKNVDFVKTNARDL